MAETKAEITEESFIGKFMVLKGSIRELWIIFGTKIMTILAYSLVNSVLVLWLSSDLRLSDKSAGWIIGYWSIIMTAFTVMVGSLVDAVGIRKSLIAGFGLAALARLVMAFFAAKWIAVPFGLFPLALGEALQTPVMVAAVRRFTTTRTVSSPITRIPVSAAATEATPAPLVRHNSPARARLVCAARWTNAPSAPVAPRSMAARASSKNMAATGWPKASCRPVPRCVRPRPCWPAMATWWPTSSAPA